MIRVIKNTDMLAVTPLRRDALLIAEAAYAAINTEHVIKDHLSLSGNVLSVDGREYDLKKFERVKVLGFGKASCKAVQTIESILRARITEGIAIDVRAGVCDIIQVKQGTHPRPTPGNVELTRGVVEMAKSTERDLVIVAVSGGGSSLLCWPSAECEQGVRLYDDLLKVGATIDEMNTVRKHISEVKGGGLAAMLHPATVIGLVFCDVPGDRFADVASGPTYYDESTLADAQAVLDRYGLIGYTLNETPKDKSLFGNVLNVSMVSNNTALRAMEAKANELGYTVACAGDALYDEPASLVTKIRGAPGGEGPRVVVAGGEPRLVVSKNGGKGGRCQYVSLEALRQLGDNEVFLSIASDGIDNSDSAGAISDSGTKKIAEEQGVSIKEHLDNFNTYEFFEKTGDLLFTGETDANVSDLYVYLRA
jgi:glycerate-2-kinase